jgi:hypothetical protein
MWKVAAPTVEFGPGHPLNQRPGWNWYAVGRCWYEVRRGPDTPQQAGARAGEGNKALECRAVAKDAANVSLVTEEVAKSQSFEPDCRGKVVRLGRNAFFYSPVCLPDPVGDFQMAGGAIQVTPPELDH